MRLSPKPEKLVRKLPGWKLGKSGDSGDKPKYRLSRIIYSI